MRQKVTKYNPDNILGWSESDFRDVICQMVNVKFLTNEPITPLMNCYYMNESDEWKREKLGITHEFLKEEKIKKLEQELRQLRNGSF